MFGKLLTMKMFPKEEEQLNISRFLKLRGTEYFELDWLPAVIVKFQELLSMRV